MDRSCGIHEVVDKSWRLHEVIDRWCGIHEVMDRSWRLHEVVDRWWGVHEGVDTSCGIHKGVDGSWDLHEGLDYLKISTYIMYASPSVPLFFLGFWGFLVYFFHWNKLEVYFLNKWDEIANIVQEKTGVKSLRKLSLNSICRRENAHVHGQIMARFSR